ncbi:unnamed protein product [Victoria cruziana]
MAPESVIRMAALVAQQQSDESLDHHYFTSESASSPSSNSETYPPPQYPTYKLSAANLSYSLHLRRKITTLRFRLHRRSARADHSVNLLDNISFVANPSEILAVVGPSGVGKSTLLRIVAGRAGAGGFDPGAISVNGDPVRSCSQLRKLCGFITQDDNLLPLLTVRETLMFSAKFRLKEKTADEKKERVEALIQELGLSHAADTFVGNEEHRGISGGERKRVSIGVEVIHDPPVLILDEPTSGLDSASAMNVIEMLDCMARDRGRTIILTIHQPSYRILHHISNLLVLSRGTVAYHGGLLKLEHTIQGLGFKIPDQLNPLEYAMEISRDLEELHKRSTGFDSMIEEYKCPPAVADDNGDNGLVGWRFYEIVTLSSRFWKIIYRTKQLFLARTMQAVVAGLGLGSVYLRVKKDQTGVTERMGLFAFSLSFLLSSTVEALPIFLEERRVLLKEASRGAYRVSSYMIANTVVFVPFLFVVAFLFSVPVYWLVGLNPTVPAFVSFVLLVWLIVLMASSLVLFLCSVSPDYIAGNSLICTVHGAFFLFSGYFIAKESIPKYWLPMYYVSLYKYPLDSLIINEYWGLKRECFSWGTGPAGPACLLTGADVLRNRGLENDARFVNVGIMIAFFLFYRILCWLILARRVSKTKI